MEEKIKELATTNALTDAYLILQQVKRLRTNLALELQVSRRCRVAQEKEFREFMDELRETLRHIRADSKIVAQLFTYIKEGPTGEKRWQKQDSSPSRTLDALSKKTH